MAEDGRSHRMGPDPSRSTAPSGALANGWAQFVSRPTEASRSATQSGASRSVASTTESSPAEPRSDLGGGEETSWRHRSCIGSLGCSWDHRQPRSAHSSPVVAEGEARSHRSPLKEQLSQNEAFIERSRRRIAELDKERAAEVLELEKAEERRARLVEAIASEEDPVDRQDPSSELEMLRLKVAHLEAARERRSERGSVEASEKHRARAVKRRAGFCGDDVMPCSEQPLREWLESKHSEMQDALDLGDMESVGLLTDLISRGAKKLADFSNPPSAVANMVM